MDEAERERWSETLAATHTAFAEYVNSVPDDEAHVVKLGGKLSGAQLHTVLRYLEDVHVEELTSGLEAHRQGL